MPTKAQTEQRNKALKPFTSDQSREEAVKNGQLGGVKSGEARREKKLWKEVIAERLGYEDMNAIVDKLVENAKTNGGRDYEILQEAMGQKPITETKVDMDADVNIDVKIG